jgi:hypothetical protein
MELVASVPIRCDHRTVAGLSGNEAIEDAAIQWGMDLERTAWRQPYDAAMRAHLPI